jgi:hypothetical protein
MRAIWPISLVLTLSASTFAHYRATYDPRHGLVCYASLNWKDPKTDEERPYEETLDFVCAENTGIWPRASRPLEAQ